MVVIVSEEEEVVDGDDVGGGWTRRAEDRVPEEGGERVAGSEFEVLFGAVVGLETSESEGEESIWLSPSLSADMLEIEVM